MKDKLLGRKARMNWGTHSAKEIRKKEHDQWQKEALEELEHSKNDVPQAEFENKN